MDNSNGKNRESIRVGKRPSSIVSSTEKSSGTIQTEQLPCSNSPERMGGSRNTTGGKKRGKGVGRGGGKQLPNGSDAAKRSGQDSAALEAGQVEQDTVMSELDLELTQQVIAMLAVP